MWTDSIDGLTADELEAEISEYEGFTSGWETADDDDDVVDDDDELENGSLDEEEDVNSNIKTTKLISSASVRPPNMKQLMKNAR